MYRWAGLKTAAKTFLGSNLGYNVLETGNCQSLLLTVANKLTTCAIDSRDNSC